MQHRFHCLSSLAVAAALLAGAPVRAAELGDIAVRTYLNQPLTADIELVMLSPDEVAEGVPVRMAAANIYQGANVRMHPALAGARMSVQRKDQRLFVHIVTLQPVDTEVVHLYLELGNGSRAVVRAATLWLTPEPPGAPRPPVVRPVPVASAPEPAPLPPPVARAPAETKLRAAPMPPPAELPPAAPAHPAPAATATADPALPGFAPSEAALIAARARANAEREALTRRAAYGTDLLRQAPQHSTPARAACVPGGKGEQARQCVALDQKNMELNAKIRDLEGKVHALQTAMGAPATAAAATASGASTASAASMPSGAAASTAAPTAASTAAATAGAATTATAASTAAAAAASTAASTAASAPVASASAGTAASAASAPMNPAGAVIPPTNGHGTNGNGKRRGGLNTTTQIVLGVVAALAVLGGLAYLVRKNKLKLPSKDKLMFWKRWKGNKGDALDAPPAEPQEPVMDKDGE